MATPPARAQRGQTAPLETFATRLGLPPITPRFERPLFATRLGLPLFAALGMACSGGGATPVAGPPDNPPPPADTTTESETIAAEDPVPPQEEEPLFTEGPLDSGDLPGWTPPERPRDKAACRVVEKAQADASKSNAKLPPNAERLTIQPLPCVPSKGGVWGLAESVRGYERNPFDRVRRATCTDDEGDPCLFDAKLGVTPMFVTASGAVKKGDAFEITTFFDRAPSSLDVGAFDFDGDGQDELLSSFGSSKILTVKGDQVVPYPPADRLAFRKVADIDEDGRPDLVLDNPYWVPVDELGCAKPGGSGVINLVVEISMVARSMPDGTFSTSDPKAAEILKQECPEMPKSIVVKDATGHFDNQQIRRNIVCARVHGASAQKVVSALDAGCKWPGSATDDCDALFAARDGRPTSVCAGRDHLVSWAKLAPPVTLKKTAPPPNTK